MPSQAELDLLLSDPEAFLRQHAIRWAGKGPDTQQNITAAIIDAGGDSQARVRTGSQFLGFGNAKANVSSFILRDTAFANGQTGAPGTLQFQIGRASCRERVEISVVAVLFKQKTAYEM